jgi:hypothetical protein
MGSLFTSIQLKVGLMSDAPGYLAIWQKYLRFSLEASNARI